MGRFKAVDMSLRIMGRFKAVDMSLRIMGRFKAVDLSIRTILTYCLDVPVLKI